MDQDELKSQENLPDTNYGNSLLDTDLYLESESDSDDGINVIIDDRNAYHPRNEDALPYQMPEEGIYEATETRDCLVFTQDCLQNTQKVENLTGLDTVFLKGMLHSVGFVMKDPEGTMYTPAQAKAAYVRELAHFDQVQRICNHLEEKKPEYEIINMEAISGPKLFEERLRATTFIPELSMGAPDICIYVKQPDGSEKLFVVEVTTARNDIVVDKLKKYNADTSSHVSVYQRPLTAYYGTFFTGPSPHPELKEIESFLLEEEFDDLLGVTAANIRQHCESTGISLVILDLQEVQPNHYLTWTLKEFTLNYLNAWPRQFYRKARERMENLPVNATFQETWDACKDAYYLLKEDQDEGRGDVQLKDYLEQREFRKTMEAGHQYWDQVKKPEDEMPVLEIDRPWNPTRPIHEKTMFHPLLDPFRMHVIGPPRGREDQVEKRVNNTLMAMFGRVPDSEEGDLIRELKELLYKEEIGFNKGTNPVASVHHASLLGFGKKIKEAKGLDATYGSEPKTLHYPYHDRTDGETMKTKLLETQNKLINLGYSAPIDMITHYNVDYFQTEIKERIPYKRDAAFLKATVYNTDQGLVNFDVLLARDTQNLLSFARNATQNSINAVFLDGDMPCFYEKNVPNGVYLTPGRRAEKIVGPDQVPVSTDYDGRKIAWLNLHGGIAVGRMLKGNESGTKKMTFLLYYRRYKTPEDFKVNIAGHRVGTWDVTGCPSQEVVCMQINQFPYNLAGLGGIHGRWCSMIASTEEMYCNILKIGETIADSTITAQQVINVLADSVGSEQQLKSFAVDHHWATILKGSASSRENESNNKYLATFAIFGNDFSGIKCSKDIKKSFESLSILWPVREERLVQAEILKKHGIMELGKYHPESETGKKIRKKDDFEPIKDFIVKDTTGLMGEMFREVGVNKENLTEDITKLAAVYQRVRLTPGDKTNRKEDYPKSQLKESLYLERSMTLSKGKAVKSTGHTVRFNTPDGKVFEKKAEYLTG